MHPEENSKDANSTSHPTPVDVRVDSAQDSTQANGAILIKFKFNQLAIGFQYQELFPGRIQNHFQDFC